MTGSGSEDVESEGEVRYFGETIEDDGNRRSSGRGSRAPYEGRRPTARGRHSPAVEGEDGDEEYEDDEEDKEESEEEEEEGEDEEEDVAGRGGHNSEWDDSYELGMGLQPVLAGGHVVSATCKFCMRFGRKRPQRANKRAALKTVKKFCQFRKDQIQRHHEGQHRVKYREYMKQYGAYKAERNATVKRRLHTQLLVFFARAPAETVDGYVEKLSEDVVIQPELLALARGLLDEPGETEENDSSDSDLENPIR
eukprot:GHVU01209556.1.p1 GENE.GHVU01209556.1~~GHVU01209556.1.p1  ORF type:complete len:252 (-),score=56.99 GHVU01209556.1:462-1217(-)